MISEPLTITSLAASGAGIARDSSGKVYFIRGGIPQDQLTCLIQKSSSSFNRGTIHTIISPSPLRQAARVQCEVYRRCGGCTWMDIDHSQQLQWKKEMLVQALTKHLPESMVSKVTISLGPTSHPWHYRSRLQLRLHVTDQGVIKIGYFASGSHSLIPIKTCPIATPVLQKVIVKLSQLSGQKILPSACKMTLLLQEIATSSELNKAPVAVMILNTNPPHTDVTGFINWLNKHVSICAKRGSYSGLALWDQYQDVEYWGSPASFFQSHKIGNDDLRQMIANKAHDIGAHTVYDLYAGSGNLSLLMVADGKQVTGIEESPASVCGAEFSRKQLLSKRSGLKGFSRYYQGKSERDIRVRAQNKEVFDLVMLNPPRSGAGNLLHYLTEVAREHLFYVSCYPLSLAADLGKLYRRGDFKHIESITIFDFYPHTPHFETWVHFCKN
ncbi:MAG: hypothetical protein OXC40_07195 [Proteobacteria bacterium]|nr:hypothetical protein [Pseudomonadota bacterium]